MSNSRFVIYIDKAGYFRWYLQAINGEKVAASEGYTSKHEAIDSAKRVKTLAWLADIVDITN